MGIVPRSRSRRCELATSISHGPANRCFSCFIEWTTDLPSEPVQFVSSARGRASDVDLKYVSAVDDATDGSDDRMADSSAPDLDQ